MFWGVYINNSEHMHLASFMHAAHENVLSRTVDIFEHTCKHTLKKLASGRNTDFMFMM
jgi:hypothetical protein